MFVTKWNFVEGEQSLFDDKEIVETAGYVPRQKTIENLLMCGQRLVESRMDEYDGATVEEALEKAPLCRVNNLGLDESLDLLGRLSDEARESKVDAGSGVSMQLNGTNSESGTDSELSKGE